ncbi:MAG TPA: DnaJ domain-containing protein [Candidatus Obscuribacterales bacterium]
MTEFEEDYYAILGVEETASPDEIRKAYLRLAKKLHPDRFPNDEEGKAAAQAEFRRVTQAHYVVGDTERRAEYDRLRQLAKSRMALRTGEPGAAAPAAGQDAAATQVDIQAQESINQKWAAKHMSRADELFRRRRYQEAETAIKEAIRLVPNEPKYRNKLAEIYLARGWRTYAMTEVQAALRIDPKDPDAKNLETKIKALARESGPASKQGKKGFFQQLKEILNKKL